jgi:hypothetical protein
VVHGNGHSLEHTADDDCFPQSAVSCFEERQHKSLIERPRLEYRLFDSFKEHAVQAFVFADIVSDFVEQHKIEETLGLMSVQLRNEHLGGCVSGLWCPEFRPHGENNFLPVPEVRHYFESFREFASCVSAFIVDLTLKCLG